MFSSAGQTVALYAALEKGNFPQDLRNILHVLVSGTLDVDRLDYLIRDGQSCGVPYGTCDTRILINSLDVGVIGDHVELLFDAKAASASTIFLVMPLGYKRRQVYNHKTNVAFNAMLGRAIPEAIRDVRISAPRDFESYIEFTDDLVMSRVLSLCVRGQRLADTVYGQTLAYRRVPLHLGSVLLKTNDPAEIAQQTREKALALKVEPAQLLTAKAKSELIKPGPLPKLLSWDKRSGRHCVEAFEGRSTLFGGTSLPPAYRLLHFYIDRPKPQQERQS